MQNVKLDWNNLDALVEGLWQRLGRAVLPKGSIDLGVYRKCLVEALTDAICKRASDYQAR